MTPSGGRRRCASLPQRRPSATAAPRFKLRAGGYRHHSETRDYATPPKSVHFRNLPTSKNIVTSISRIRALPRQRSKPRQRPRNPSDLLVDRRPVHLACVASADLAVQFAARDPGNLGLKLMLSSVCWSRTSRNAER